MKNNVNFKSYNYLSEADLRKLDGWEDNLPVSSPEKFKEILFQHGADISQEIEEEINIHRMRTSNLVHEGKRWVFVERQDNEWLKSGKASLEAWMSAADKETMKDMTKMSRYAKINVSATASDDKE